MFKWMVCRFSFMYVVVFFTVAVLPPRNTRADLFVDVQDATLTSGGFGSIDVLVSSTGGIDIFSLLSYKFEIEEINANNLGVVEFQSSFKSGEAYSQSNSEQAQANYLFAGSTDFDSFSATRQDAISNKLQLVGGDERVGGNMNLTGPTKYLLARLELQHITLSPELSGGTFRVSLVKSSDFSYFRNLDLDNESPLQPRIHDDSYSLAGSGIVTIISAVPEPSSLSLVALSLCLAWRRRRA